jgi:hypothetical protein
MISGMIVQGNGPYQGFDKESFYAVLASGDAGMIDAQLSMLREETIKGKEAYEGALLMKKAGFAAGPKEKLRLFKAGYIKLESSLAKDSSNGEYHFLRLTIQEHAPRIVKYYKDQEKDCQYIYRSFGSLSPVVQKAILNYSKHSSILHAKELNG